MKRTIMGLFDTLDQAELAVTQLVSAGFGHDAISLIARNSRGDVGTKDSVSDVATDAAAEGLGTGATAGTVLGGTLGLLVGLGALVIPGIGPIIAAGTLATAMGTAALGAGVGAAAGGLVGGLTAVGVHPSDLAYYEEGIRNGGVLVAVEATDEQVPAAEEILHRRGNSEGVEDRMTAEHQAAENIDKVPLIARAS